MAQNVVNFSSDPTGTQLLDDLLAPLQQNILTTNSGTSRPSYVVGGTHWIKITTNPWEVYYYDGSTDVLAGTINTTTHQFTPAGLDTLGALAALDVVTNTDTSFTTANVGDSSTAPATTEFAARLPSSGFKNLKGVYTTNTTATYTADALLLLTTGGAACRIMSFSQVLNTATSGLGGLDTGSFASSTWYYVFAIFNKTTATSGIIFSLSATSPTLPSGYNHFMRIGSFYSDTSSKIRGFQQYGDLIAYKVGSNLTSLPVINSGATGNVSTGTYTSISISSVAPPTAASLIVLGSTTSPTNSEILIAPNGNYGSDTSSNSPLIKTYTLTGGISEIILESTNIYIASQSSTVALAYAYRENF